MGGGFSESRSRAQAGQLPAAAGRREEEAACWNACMVIATEERSLPFEKLSALRFLWSQFQRDFNCKENFVISLGEEGSTASNSPCLMRLLLQTGGFHALATWKLSGDWLVLVEGGGDAGLPAPFQGWANWVHRLGLPGSGLPQGLWCQPKHEPGVPCARPLSSAWRVCLIMLISLGKVASIHSL